MSGGQWFVGDTHFGHALVSGLRGFTDTDDHDAAIIAAWKTQVKPGDLVWVMGDISGGGSFAEDRALDIIAGLPGNKHLIAGNHDSVSAIHRNGFKKQAKFLQVFDSVQQFGRLRTAGQDIMLSHFPFLKDGDGPGRGPARHAQFRLPDMGTPLIHAHTHHTDPLSGGDGRSLCVSWDAWGRMVSRGDVDKWVRSL